jgi:hypothetical protein
VTKSCVLQKECPSLCNPNPCFHGTVQCTDVNRAHFTCGSCPAGYEGDGMVRTDVDEVYIKFELKEEAESILL